MGLDMYLHAEFYISNYVYDKVETAKYGKIMSALGLSSTGRYSSIDVSVQVAYWRKANAIHNWFVKNVQDGKDNCERYYVERKQLEELLGTCKELQTHRFTPQAEEKAQELLPPVSGFFFGSTGIDEGYWEDIESTVQQVSYILEHPRLENSSIYYQSSW